jgi:transcriptional regulator with XRE-family HTH domain
LILDNVNIEGNFNIENTSTIGDADPPKPALYVQLSGEKTKGGAVEQASICKLKVDIRQFKDASTLCEITGETLQQAVQANLEVGFVLYSKAFKIKDSISRIRTRFTETGFETPVEFELIAPEKPQECKLWLEMTISERPSIRIPIELKVVADLANVSEVLLASTAKLNVDDMIRQAQKRTPPDVTLDIRSSDVASYAQFEFRQKRRPVDEKTCHSQKLTLQSLADKLGLYAEEMKKVADDTVWNILADPMNPSNKEKEWLAKALATTADIGSKLYDWLYADIRTGKNEIKGIKEVLEKINELEPGTIIQVNSDGVAIPWEIIYPEYYRYDPNTDEQPKDVDTAKFWGGRFIFETNLTPSLRKLPEGDVDLFELHSKAERKLTVVLNNEIDKEKGIEWKAEPPVHYHESNLKNLFRQQITQCTEVKALFENDKATGSMIYFFCHGGAAKAYNPNYPETLQIAESCPLQSDRLKCDVIYQDAPIVFLNACSSGALAPISYDSYCSQFSLKGAVGLITTAFAVPAPFAARFGCQLVLEYLNAEKTLGEILFAMRKQALDAHIPIGLFYMMRCPADISLKASNEEDV